MATAPSPDAQKSKIIVLLTNSSLLKRTIEESFHPDKLQKRHDSSTPVIARACSARGNLMTIYVTPNHTTSPYSKAPQTNIQPTSLSLYSKIDLLIVDSDDFKLFEPHRVKTIINLSNKNLTTDEIKISKPFQLNTLLKLIESTVKSQDIFCALNKDFVYNERSQKLTSKEKTIKLTEKENDIFKALLLSPNFQLSKESLLKTIWQYHEDSESLTAQTHLYKLKTKLPDEMLEVKNNVCQLNIITKT